MNVGDKIRMKREELGMSQDELAAILGYKNRSSVAKIESGNNGIRQSKIIQIATALGMRPIDLIDKPDNFETRAISYQTYLDNNPTMYELNDIIKKYVDDNTFVGKVLEYAQALDLLYKKNRDTNHK